jgi:uncharacterized protein YndB with AHSA1/START domain
LPIDFSIDVDIARPPAEVFAVVADPSRLPEWQPLVVEVEMLEDGPLREGSRVREVRAMRKKRIEQIVEVSELDPPRRFGVRIVEGPLPVNGDLTFSPVADGGTRLHVHAHGSPRGAMRLLGPLLTVGLRREFRKQYRGLKELVEAGA